LNVSSRAYRLAMVVIGAAGLIVAMTELWMGR
jgi:hypothetical protein